MAQRDAYQLYRGTIEEVLSHRGEIPPGATVELKVFEPTPEDEASRGFGGKSLAEMLAEIGTVKGLPADLATDPSHLQGFGEMKNRRTLLP